MYDQGKSIEIFINSKEEDGVKVCNKILFIILRNPVIQFLGNYE